MSESEVLSGLEGGPSDETACHPLIRASAVAQVRAQPAARERVQVVSA